MRVARRRRHRKWQHILRDRSAPANVGVRSDAHKLMHRTKCAHHRPFFHGYVSGQRSPVHQHAMVADHGIVPNVRVCHDQRVATHSRHSAALYRTAADGDALANLVMVANLQSRRLAFVGSILRRHADGAKRTERILRPDFRWPFKRHVRDQPATFAKLNLGADYAVGPNLARRWNLGSGIYDSGGMNVHGWTFMDK